MMKEKLLIGAAFTLLMGTAAFAQQDAPPPPQSTDMQADDPADTIDSADTQDDSADMQDRDSADEPREMRRGDRGPRHEMRGRHAGGPPHWRKHGRHGGPGMRGRGGRMAGHEGAAFRFKLGDGSTIFVKCADGDTTQACVDAVSPMLDQLINGGDGAGR